MNLFGGKIMKLTKKWKRLPHSKSSSASLNNVTLICSYRPYAAMYSKGYKWFSQVFIDGLDCRRFGGTQSSERLAKQDAERMAEELEMDAREGARQLMAKYGGVDDE
jgi:hypothetical protein